MQITSPAHSPTMNQIIALTMMLLLTCLAGCYQTATRAELDHKVQRLQGNSFPGRLILECSDDTYDYYRIEDLGVRGRYRVKRDPVK